MNQNFLRRSLFLLLWTSVFCSGASRLSAGDLQYDNPKIEADLQNQLVRQADEWVRVLVMMSDRVDTRQLESLSTSRQVRHELIVAALQGKAEETQAGLLQMLEEGKQQGQVKQYRSFWITNVLAVEGRPELIAAIANRPEVEMIYLDYPVEMIEPVSSSPAASAPGAAEAGLRDINAHKLWEIGITGSGVIVMNLDTGVDGSHPALAARWRGLEPGVDPSWAWLNIDNPTQTFPVDYGYHGTHTMGTITGMDPATDDTIGVAVGAQWIAAAWNYTTLNKFISDVIAEFNWGADPDGNPLTVDDVPAVISNSWGIGVIFGQPPCDASFWTAIDNAEAAGAAVVFAAGNEGSGAQTLRAPADRNTTMTNCFSVGALNPGSATIASFSSRGPTACPGTTEERIKPEVCARGVSVRSSYPGGTYTLLDGTSMACPHVAGALALLRDAYPNATVDELKTALMETAVDLGAAGEDNTYGHGRIDVWAAYNSLLGSGGIPCGDISTFQARCIAGGTIRARIIMTDATHAGETIEFTIDATPYPATLVTRGTVTRAQIAIGGFGAGPHTVELSDPMGCFSPVVTSCATAGKKADIDWDELDTNSPLEAGLLGNYPNPFNPTTTISYSVPPGGTRSRPDGSRDGQLSAGSWVSLKVYNTLGEEVATLVNEFQNAGYKSATWNGRNDAGSSVASGIYIYRLTTGNVVKSEKMIFMK